MFKIKIQFSQEAIIMMFSNELEGNLKRVLTCIVQRIERGLNIYYRNISLDAERPWLKSVCVKKFILYN